MPAALNVHPPSMGHCAHASKHLGSYLVTIMDFIAPEEYDITEVPIRGPRTMIDITSKIFKLANTDCTLLKM